MADDRDTPADALQAQQEDQRLGRCMGQLDEEPRRAVMLAYHEGLTHEQLAARLQRPLGTVKTWVRRSLLQLKSCLEAD